MNFGDQNKISWTSIHRDITNFYAPNIPFKMLEHKKMSPDKDEEGVSAMDMMLQKHEKEEKKKKAILKRRRTIILRKFLLDDLNFKKNKKDPKDITTKSVTSHSPEPMYITENIGIRRKSCKCTRCGKIKVRIGDQLHLEFESVLIRKSR